MTDVLLRQIFTVSASLNRLSGVRISGNLAGCIGTGKSAYIGVARCICYDNCSIKLCNRSGQHILSSGGFRIAIKFSCKPSHIVSACLNLWRHLHVVRFSSSACSHCSSDIGKSFDDHTVIHHGIPVLGTVRASCKSSHIGGTAAAFLLPR